MSTKHNGNEYVDTLKPILFLLKINGVLPIQLERGDNLIWFVISKITALTSISVYMATIISNSIYVFRQTNKLLNKFHLDRLLVMAAPITARLFILIIPFTTWGKSKTLHRYWDNWKHFQEEYESISGIVFVSRLKKKIRVATAAALSLTLATVALSQLFYYKGTVNVDFVSSCFLGSTINSVAAYWFINCVYIRSVAKDVLNLVQKTVTEGHDEQKLNKLTKLWVTLCDLMDQFNTSHSILFLGYLLLIIVLNIISFYSGVTSMIFNIQSFVYALRFTSCALGVVMIMIFCETAHSVYKQINAKQEEILLERNTAVMDVRMLNAVWGFLQTMQTRNPQINLNGFLILKRSLFPSILAVSIHYLIILRQFSLRNRDYYSVSMLNEKMKMFRNEVHDYIETMKPILFLMKILGALPFHLKDKENIPTLLTSKLTSAVAIIIYGLNVISNLAFIIGEVNYLMNDFSFKYLLAITPRFVVRSFIFMIPFCTWNKSEYLQEYWNNWKHLQNRYEGISGKTYASLSKKSIKVAVSSVIILTMMTQALGQFYVSKDSDYINFIARSLAYSTVFTTGAYWYTNCIYIKYFAADLLHLRKEVISNLLSSSDDRKSQELTSIWLNLCELMDKFNAAHSILFLIYILEIILCMIVFSFIALNYSTYEETSNIVLQLNGVLICVMLILVVCETAYSVRRQVNQKQKEILLQENTKQMTIKMLHNMTCFLQTIHVKNGELNLNGYLVLNRLVFPSILSVCINYLIILRQFSLRI